MKRIDQRGFTIIETVLFLAISGLVLLIGFQGIGSRTSGAQYNDSIRSLESTISQAYSSLSTGVRSAGLSNSNCSGSGGVSPVAGGTIGTDPGASGCVNMGVLIEFVDQGDSDVVRTYQITGDLLWGDALELGDSDTELTLVNRSMPHINFENVQETDISWGTQFIASMGTNPDGLSFTPQAFGLIRSPGSSKLFPVVMTQALDPSSGAIMHLGNAFIDASGDNTGPMGGSSDDNFAFIYCLEGVNGMRGDVDFGFSEASVGIEPQVNGFSEYCEGLTL